MHHELPARLDLEHYRKEAKGLVRRYRDNDAEAVGRVEETLGARARERFRLSDAQYLIAAERGFRSWADFRRFVESAEPEPPVGRIGRVGIPYYEQRAEALVDELRRGREAALRRVRAHVPRLADIPDAQLLGGELPARDAKLVVAREYGFPTWRDLVFYVEKAIREFEGQRDGDEAVIAALEAIRRGDVQELRRLLDSHPGLVGNVHRGAWTTLLEAIAEPDVVGDRLGPELGVDPRIVQLLIDRGSALDTPLNLAACFNRVELVEMLLAAGADVESIEIWGVTPLETALYHGSQEAADRLAERRLVPYALWVAAAAGRVELLPTFFDRERLLPEAGAHRPDLSKVGWPPGPPPRDDPAEILAEAFVLACYNGRLEAAEWLLARGVDVNARPYLGMTGLSWAVVGGRRQMVEFLIGRGADVQPRNELNGDTAAGWAAHIADGTPDRDAIRDYLASALSKARRASSP